MISLKTWLTSIALQILVTVAPVFAQPHEELSRAANCIGGVWVGQEVLTDSQGKRFIVVRECSWSKNGAALWMHQDFVYEDGARKTTSEGLTVWDPVEKTLRNFGVFSHGGVIFDSLVDVATLGTKQEVQRFKFASPQSGKVTEWQSIETHVDVNTLKEDGLMLVDGEWKTMSSVTFVRQPAFEGEKTFKDVVSHLVREE